MQKSLLRANQRGEGGGGIQLLGVVPVYPGETWRFAKKIANNWGSKAKFFWGGGRVAFTCSQQANVRGKEGEGGFGEESWGSFARGERGGDHRRSPLGGRRTQPSSKTKDEHQGRGQRKRRGGLGKEKDVAEFCWVGRQQEKSFLNREFKVSGRERRCQPLFCPIRGGDLRA